MSEINLGQEELKHLDVFFLFGMNQQSEKCNIRFKTSGMNFLFFLICTHEALFFQELQRYCFLHYASVPITLKYNNQSSENI